ncbi:MAG: type II secretion system F family protein, partial [Gaiellaceae bacterium]
APGSPVQVAGFNAGDYPHLVVNVVTAGPVHTPPRLSENGKPVSGLTTVNLGEAKSVVIAIDTSRSMGVAGLKNAAEAASFFVHRKRADDRVSVVSFGRQAAKLADFTTSSADVDSELSGLAVDGRSGTALYDAIIESARALQSSRLSGRVIVVLTDGRDVSSNVTLEQAVNAANTVGAAVYPIGVESPDFRSGALRTLARETNGTYYGAGSSQGLEQVYSSIAAELDRTWRVGYDTTARPGDTLRLHATVPGFGSADRQVEVPAAFATPASASASGLLPKDFYSPLGTLVLAIAVGLLTLLAVLLFVQLSRGSWVKQRLAAHVGDAQRLRMRRTDRMSFLAALFRATEGILGRRKQWRVIQKMLVRGDVPLRPAEFLWLSLGCSAVAGLLFAAASAPSLLILLAMGAGCVLPLLFVSLRVRRRARAFENQLPDLLTTIAASLKAGHSFKHGLQAVVEESQPPASVELQRALTEAGLGRPMDDALAEMADRVGSENFAFAITAVTIQRQVGGSLAALFDMVSETVRNRQQFARKIRSLTAMGRMSAYTLVGIPFFIAGMISLANPTYMHPLVHTGVGHILLFLGLSMIAVGSLILKKIVSFKG